MGSRQRLIDSAAARGRATNAQLIQDLRQQRLDRGLGSSDIPRAAGLSPAQYSRIERGLTGPISIQQATVFFALLGLDLTVRVYPAGEPLRDAAHAALLDRFRVRLHRSLRFMTEVPFAATADRRAWDAVVVGAGWRHGIEAETRPRDRQAMERRLALKLRDGDVSSMTLLLLASRHNRDFLRAHGGVLRERFPIPGSRAMELLRVGVDPGGNSIVLL
jgi:hypothetical protein